MRNPLNRTHLEHLIGGLAIQLGTAIVVTVLFGIHESLFAGGCLAAGFYLGREETQHSMKHPKGIQGAPWYYGLVNHWSEDSRLDWSVVLLAVLTAWQIGEVVS